MTEILIGQSSLADLQSRRNLCLAFIKIISGMDDPRRADALREYNRQLSEIDKKIEVMTGKPPDTIIGLKTAVLFAKSERS